MVGADLARTVTAGERTRRRRSWVPRSTDRGPVHRVAAYDFGIKRNILRLLAEAGIEATVFPAETPATRIAAGGFDGVFLSNGPGDPAATAYGIAAAEGAPREGAVVRDLPRPPAARPGARRADLQDEVRPPRREPAREERPHRHGGDHESTTTGSPWTPGDGRRDPDGGVLGDFGRVALTHWNLNDGTLEGLRCLDVPAFSVQYHPEAAPGPHDSRYLFEDFRDLIGGGLNMPRRDDLRKIMVIGSGPIVIGQACEFDYSGTQACKVLRREGYEVALVNSNPATIMTDPQFADRTYIEPLEHGLRRCGSSNASGRTRCCPPSVGRPRSTWRWPSPSPATSIGWGSG